MNSNKNIILAGGGTGGHIFPAIAIAHALKKARPNWNILFIGAKGKMEMEKVPKAGYDIEGLDIAGFNRSSLLKNIGLPWKLLKSFLKVRSIFSSFQPDAVVGVGGYSSFPVLKYAQQQGIPTFIHESNSFAGKSNQLLGKNASRIMVASEGMDKFFPANKLVRTGNPVRAAIASATVTREEAIRFFGLQPDRPVLLVVGGSLGAQSINRAIADGLGAIQEAGVQLIWQTGSSQAAEFQQRAAAFSNVKLLPFIAEMEMAYAAADLVISRAGAMAIAELSVAGKAALLVPYPHAAENHQWVNADTLVKDAAARMISDAVVSGELIPVALRLMRNEAERKGMEINIKKRAMPQADEAIAALVIDFLENKTDNHS